MMEPLSPLLGPFQSRSQNGSFQVRSSFQEEADSGTPLPPDRPISKPKPKWSVPRGSSPARPISKQKPKWSVAGPFFIPRESCSSSPAFVLYRLRRSSSISESLFRPSKISEGFSISRLFGMNRSFLLRWAEVGEEEELNILTSTERQKIFSCQLRR